MKIRIPDAVRAKLIANGKTPDHDHVPLIKLFGLGFACTWLISEIQPYDTDLMFGLCDLGMGFPEIGPVSLSEIERVTEDLNVIILSEPGFEGRYPLSVYAEAASVQQAITTIPSLLEAAAERLAARRRNAGRN